MAVPDRRAVIQDVLSSLEAVLREERELFGDTLLVGPPPNNPTEVPMSLSPRRAAPEEPELFAAPVPPPPGAGEPWAAAGTLDALEGMICECRKCPLGTTRTKFVFGVGNHRATLMLIGEAPGADEDAQGEPFVGRAGQLLNRILEAIHFRREEVYICNILKCRPPNNRTPEAEEVAQCLPYLRRQIALVRPKMILCLGLTAARNLLKTPESLSQLRGRTLTYEGTPLMVTYHPAALLRNPAWKRPVWEDVQAARKLHDELVAAGS